MRKRVGDTLIEVSIAIGIFSMVAISIVAVMNGGTSSSQTALETTLAREEIDTQAEALRFIQSAYIADRDSGKGAGTDSGQSIYNKAWGEIVGTTTERALAIDPNTPAYGGFQDIINNTTSCDVYSNEVFKNHAFIVNPKNMNIVTAKNNDIFKPASTYPRLIMSSQIDGDNTLSDNLVDNSLSGDLSRVEGLYVFAVKDADTTNITDPNNSDTSSKSAFLDFYIRACWYGNGDDTPSTISTVVRLYNPDATATASKATGVWVKFNPNNREGLTAAEGSTPSVFIPIVGDKPTLTANSFTRDGYKFIGWSTSPNSTPSDVNSGKPGTYKDKANYTPPSSLAFNDEVTLYAIWQTQYFIKYDSNGGSPTPSTTDCDKNYGCKITSNTPDYRSSEGLAFKGWCTKKPAANDGTCPGVFYEQGGQYNDPLPMNKSATFENGNYYATLYAVWSPHYTLYFYDTNGETVLCKLEQDENDTFNIGECNKDPTDKGGGHTFQGWSTNDQEPYYNRTGSYTSFTVPDSGNRTSKLYPVWRVSIKFSSEGWTPQTSDGTESGCAIFNYNVPSGTYKKNGSYYYEYTNNRYNYNKYYYPISAGGRYGDGNTAPANGYIVVGSGKNVEVLDSGIINLQGFCGTCRHGAYKAGVSYAVGKDDTFELSAKMNTNGMHDHPGGHVDISIGPVTATINKTSITSSCKRANGITTNGLSYSFTSNSVINLRIAKHGNDYDIYVENKKLISCNVTTTKSVQVEYNMIHQDHCCGEIFNTQLYGIEMQQYKK